MSHSEVYKWFELYFPQYAGDKVESWFQNGKNSIRIRQKNHQEFIFTYNLCCSDNFKLGCYENRAEGPGTAYQKAGKRN